MSVLAGLSSYACLIVKRVSVCGSARVPKAVGLARMQAERAKLFGFLVQGCMVFRKILRFLLFFDFFLIFLLTIF